MRTPTTQPVAICTEIESNTLSLAYTLKGCTPVEVLPVLNAFDHTTGISFFILTVLTLLNLFLHLRIGKLYMQFPIFNVNIINPYHYQHCNK